MSRRDPSVSALLLPQLVQRLQEQTIHLENATGALKAVSDLARCVRKQGDDSTHCSELDASSLGHLASTLARAVELPLREIDAVTGELERCQPRPFLPTS
jgi:hypothetical protein